MPCRPCRYYSHRRAKAQCDSGAVVGGGGAAASAAEQEREGQAVPRAPRQRRRRLHGDGGGGGRLHGGGDGRHRGAHLRRRRAGPLLRHGEEQEPTPRPTAPPYAPTLVVPPKTYINMLYFLMPQAVGVGGIEIAPAKIKGAGGQRGLARGAS